MVFGVVHPAFAEYRTGSAGGDAAAYGTAGAVIAAGALGALTFFTGGLALPFIVGGAAVAGAGAGYYGYAVEEKTLAKDAGVLVGAGIAGAGVAVAASVAVTAIAAGSAAGGAAAGSAATAGGVAGTGLTAGEIAGGVATIGGGGAVIASQQNQKGSYSHVPVDGHGGTWSGQRGNSNWVMDGNATPANKLYNPDKLTWNEINAKYRNDIKSIPYKNGEPDFSKVALATLKIDNFTNNRYPNFKNADQNYADILNRNNNLNLTAKDIEKFRNDNNLTWHERSDMKTVDLIPREYHSLPHVGGISNANR